MNPRAHLVHVGRQPIFDAAGRVVAYELLFRGSMDAVRADRQDTYVRHQPRHVKLDLLDVVNAYEKGDLAGRYLDAIRWSALAVAATSRLTPA